MLQRWFNPIWTKASIVNRTGGGADWLKNLGEGTIELRGRPYQLWRSGVLSESLANAKKILRVVIKKLITLVVLSSFFPSNAPRKFMKFRVVIVVISRGLLALFINFCLGAHLWPWPPPPLPPSPYQALLSRAILIYTFSFREHLVARDHMAGS